MWKEYGYVLASKYRKKCVRSLCQHPKSPTQIATENGLHLVHVSRALRELSDKEIVICINPEVSKGKIYSLTEIGIDISKYIH